MDDLKSAFDWCLMNNISLVNLSFGTTHFKDKGIIRQLVNQYANKGLITVSYTHLDVYKRQILDQMDDTLGGLDFKV